MQWKVFENVGFRVGFKRSGLLWSVLEMRLIRDASPLKSETSKPSFGRLLGCCFRLPCSLVRHQMLSFGHCSHCGCIFGSTYMSNCSRFLEWPPNPLSRGMVCFLRRVSHPYVLKMTPMLQPLARRLLLGLTRFKVQPA